jgi:hypothetical protein
VQGTDIPVELLAPTLDALQNRAVLRERTAGADAPCRSSTGLPRFFLPEALGHGVDRSRFFPTTASSAPRNQRGDEVGDRLALARAGGPLTIRLCLPAPR